MQVLTVAQVSTACNDVAHTSTTCLMQDVFVDSTNKGAGVMGRRGSARACTKKAS